jgi:hypothetical protein
VEIIASVFGNNMYVMYHAVAGKYSQGRKVEKRHTNC